MKKNLLLLSLLFLAGAFETVRAQVPVIVASPTNMSVCAGAHTFVSLFANNATSYIWQLSGDLGDHWADISDNSIFTGATTRGLFVAGDISLNGKLLRCIVSNANGSVESARVVVQVDTALPQPTFFINQVTTVCQGASQFYYLDGAELVDTLFWKIPGASVYQPNVTDTTTEINFNGPPGLYALSAYARNGCGNSDTSVIDITVNPLQAVPAGVADGNAVCTMYSVIPGASNGYSDNSCSPISAIIPNGAKPVIGVIQSCVTVDPAVQSFNGIPYVPRHYSLSTFGDGSTSTATVTLYFTQADFDAYNAARGSNLALPTMPSDATGIANLHITQFHGFGTTPDTYVSGNGDIDPDDNNIIWNATANRWEVTFDITGFSGFFVSGGSLVPLPLTLVNFTGKTTAGGNLLQWETASEENTAYFDVERKAGSGGSAVGSGGGGFLPLAKVAAAGNSNRTLDYSYTDELASGLQGALSYRLHMVDLDGQSTYSKIVVLQPAAGGLSIRISPNPSHQPLTLTVSSPQSGPAVLLVTDISGRSIGKQPLALQKGENSLGLRLIAALPKGVYFISVTTDIEKQTVKFIRE